MAGGVLLKGIRRHAFVLAAISLFGVPSLYIAGFMSGVPKSFYYAISLSATGALVQEFFLNLCVATFLGRFVFLILSASLKIISHLSRKARKLWGGWWGGVGLYISVARKALSGYPRVVEVVLMLLIFLIRHLGPWVVEYFLMKIALFGFVLFAVVWLTRFYEFFPRRGNVEKISTYRLAEAATYAIILFVIFFSFSLGQHRFVLSALSCEQLRMSDDETHAAAPIFFSEQGLFAVRAIEIGTPWSLYSVINDVDMVFYPYSSVKMISGAISSNLSARIDRNGRTTFDCK